MVYEYTRHTILYLRKRVMTWNLYTRGAAESELEENRQTLARETGTCKNKGVKTEMHCKK